MASGANVWDYRRESWRRRCLVVISNEGSASCAAQCFSPKVLVWGELFCRKPQCLCCWDDEKWKEGKNEMAAVTSFLAWYCCFADQSCHGTPASCEWCWICDSSWLFIQSLWEPRLHTEQVIYVQRGGNPSIVCRKLLGEWRNSLSFYSEMDNNQPFALSQQLKSVLLTSVGSFPPPNATASQDFWILGKN